MSFECAYCGKEVQNTDIPATKAWCSDWCYQLDKAQEQRRNQQDGLEEWSG